MQSYPHGGLASATSNDWDGAESSSHCSAPDIDAILAGAGYRVRSLDLLHVAQSLEQLESAMISDHLQSESTMVHYNPSDLTAWVNSMLSEIATVVPDPSPLVCHSVEPSFDSWTDNTELQLQQQKQQRRTVQASCPRQLQADQEEDSAIRLVHLLISCADSVQRGDAQLAGNLLEEMRLSLTLVNTGFGIGKVAGYFIDALCQRLYSPSLSGCSGGGSAAENEILYHHFYEACPYLKFAHFTANQAILESFQGHDRVHVVDFNLMQGLQWPALIQALALRPGGPPFLRLTGIGPPSPDGRDTLREIGLRLAELARSVHVRFAFRGVAASRLDDLRPWMVQVAPGEAVAINSVMQLHRLLRDPENAEGQAENAPIDAVLGWIVGLKPKIVIVVEQEADHNKPAFLDRFTEALFYYSAMFDSLEGGGGRGGHQQQQRDAAALAEVYLQREICNIVCSEGPARVERHEPLYRWRARLRQAGLREVHLGSNAFKQARMLLTLFSCEGYSVEEADGCLTVGWHSRPLIFASAWRAEDHVAAHTADCSGIAAGNNYDDLLGYLHYIIDNCYNSDNNNYINKNSSSSNNCDNHNNSNSEGNIVKSTGHQEQLRINGM